MRFEQKIGTLTVKSLLAYKKTKKLNLNPGFQRQSVWKKSQQKALIQSLLYNMPIPTIFLWQRKKGNKVIFDVIDGKQRSEAILAFTAAKSSLPVKIEPGDDTDWGKWAEPGTWSWKDICRDAPKKKKAFLNYAIPTVTVEGSLEDIEKLFVNLNSTGSKLTKQEILNAKYHRGSSLLKVSDKLARSLEEYFIKSGILSAGQISRMKSVELIAELILSMEGGDVLNKKKALDSLMSHTRISQNRLNTLAKEIGQTVRYLDKYFPKINTTRFKKIPDFYALTFALWRLTDNGIVIKNKKRADVAFALLTRLSLDIAKSNQAYRDGKGVKLPPLAREYHRTVVSGSDTYNHRKERVKIIDALIHSVFETKADKRAFSDEQKQLLWHSSKDVICNHCRKPILGWNDAEVDHIKPYAKGGKTVLKNAQLLHAECNRKLGVKGRR